MTSLSLHALQKWTVGPILPVSHSLPSCLPIRKANLCNWTSKRAEDFLSYERNEKALLILIQGLNKLECIQRGVFKWPDHEKP